MAEEKYNWRELKNEFFISEFSSVQRFIRQRLDKDTANDKNAANHTKGWAEDKKAWERRRLEKALAEVDQGLREKMKITLEDLLINKKLLFSLDTKYLEIQAKIQNKDPGQQPTKEELVYFRSFSDKLKDVANRLQLELGLPTNISELQGSQEKPLVLIELLREARKGKRDADYQG